MPADALDHPAERSSRSLIVAQPLTKYVSLMPSDPGLVHIIDDDEAVRKGLASLVRSVGNDVRVYSSTDEFLATELPPLPSCLLLDIRLPGMNGLAFQATLQDRGVELPVILMTGFGDIQMSVKGMKAGATSRYSSSFARKVSVTCLNTLSIGQTF